MLQGNYMESTVIAIMLASAVVFWNAPFAAYLIPAGKILQRYSRRILFVILLLLLAASETHTSSLVIPASRCPSETYAAACHENPKVLTITALNAPPIF